MNELVWYGNLFRCNYVCVIGPNAPLHSHTRARVYMLDVSIAASYLCLVHYLIFKHLFLQTESYLLA